jgi:predicted transcriptional regulator
MIEMAQITTAELATELGTTPREVRKFLRSDESPISSVGKGSRYSIEKRDIRSLRSKFSKWDEARKAAKTDNAPEAPEGDDTPES